VNSRASHRLERGQLIARPLEPVFAFFADARNLQAITPDFLHFRMRTSTPVDMKAGARIDYTIVLFGVPIGWRTRITEWRPGVRFVDEQESGPYARWIHTHEFEARGDATFMRDHVEYVEPLGLLGAVAHHLFVARTLDRIFDFRARAVHRLLEPVPGRSVNR
jgi:ligand-binding SRPBCC domain-containing protein